MRLFRSFYRAAPGSRDSWQRYCWLEIGLDANPASTGPEMKVTLRQNQACSDVCRCGFTIIEVLFAMGMAGLMFITLYTGLQGGFAIMRLARENTRATQILVEKMETIRLYNWDQINSNGFIPSSFTAAYYPMGGSNCGTIYTGTVSIASPGLGTSYDDDMRKVTVRLDWLTGNLPRTRSACTYVSRYGLQNYVY